MYKRRANAQAQPLPAVGRLRRRIPLGYLAAATAAPWLIGAALAVGQSTAYVSHAPQLVRAAVWVMVCGCLAIGLVCLACCAAAAHAAVATARRRALYGSGALALSDDREHHRALAELAADLDGDTLELRNVRPLRAVGGDRHNGARTRYGA